MPEDGVVVAVVVADESGAHVAAFLHGREEAGVECRGAYALLARSDERSLVVGHGFAVFGQGDVEERISGPWGAAIGCRERAACPAVPFHLVASDVVVSLDTFDL